MIITLPLPSHSGRPGHAVGQASDLRRRAGLRAGLRRRLRRTVCACPRRDRPIRALVPGARVVSRPDRGRHRCSVLGHLRGRVSARERVAARRRCSRTTAGDSNQCAVALRRPPGASPLTGGRRGEGRGRAGPLRRRVGRVRSHALGPRLCALDQGAPVTSGRQRRPEVLPVAAAVLAPEPREFFALAVAHIFAGVRTVEVSRAEGS